MLFMIFGFLPMRLNYLAFQYVDLSVPGEGCCRTRKAPAMFDENVFCNLEIYNLRFWQQNTASSYVVMHMESDCKGRLGTQLHDKRYYFNFPVVSFPFICQNIIAACVTDHHKYIRLS
jgi:hypothetical protein